MERAVAAQVAAALEQYDRLCADMVRTWLDMERYAAVSALVDEMRSQCASLSRLSLPWAAFLVSHSELVFCLWRAGNSGNPELRDCVRNHAVAVGNLRQGCLRLCAGDQGRPGTTVSRWSASPR